MQKPTKLYRATLREVETRVVDVVFELTEEQFEKHKYSLKHAWLENYSSVEEAAIVDIAAYVLDKSTRPDDKWQVLDTEFSASASVLNMTLEQFMETDAKPNRLSVYAPSHKTVTFLLKGE